MLVKIEQMAPVSSTVLIQGESGTGKELVAQGASTTSSPRRGKPFIAVNCAALPETLLESELFGHEKGAFTGAAERRLGRFELADSGTIFLDEIGEIPPSTQVKLLRVLESRTFFRVGGTQPIKVDVRVLAATNRPLRDAVALGEFRDDLYYRLNVLNIYLPPLRERREDIPLLVRRFIREFAARARPARSAGITPEAMERLVSAPLAGQRAPAPEPDRVHGGAGPRRRDPGGATSRRDILEGPGSLLPVRVRTAAGREVPGQELEFILRSLLELKLQVEELRRRLDDQSPAGPGHRAGRPRDRGRRASEADDRNGDQAVVYRSGMTMAEVEKAAIDAALREHRGNRRRAAEVLGIGERTLYRKIKTYHLE